MTSQQEAILKLAHSILNRHPGPFTQQHYLRHRRPGDPSLGEVRSAFPGGWRQLKAQLGQTSVHSDQQLLDRLAKAAREDHEGRMLTARQIDDHPGLPSAALYIKRFSDLDTARQQAGLKPHREPTTPDSILTQALPVAKRLGHTPEWSEWQQAHQDDPQLPSVWQIYRHFGGQKGAWAMFRYHLLEIALQQDISLTH